MTDEIDDAELDGILDEALEEFNHTKPTDGPQPSNSHGNNGKEAQNKTPSSIPEEPATLPQPDEMNPVFEEALKALGDLGLGQEKIDDDVTEADLKLVEEFMTSLGSSLNGFGASTNTNDKNTANENDILGKKNQPEVERLVDSIVGHLLSEDVLKGPMNQMKEAYADWMPKNAESLSAEEFGRYSRQQELIETICEKYESNTNTSEIMELLSIMQETGAPPEDVMKSLNSVPGSAENLFTGVPTEDLDKCTEKCAMQ